MKILITFLTCCCIGFAQQPDNLKNDDAISMAIDAWHKAAADAQFKNYFDLMTEQSVFIGTDHTEKWQKDAFMAYAKPHFDKGKAWSFTSIDREIVIYSADLAWFDELLTTQMGICRGAGIMKKVGGQWKIDRYVLSISIPNDNSDEIIKIKTPIESAYLKAVAK